MGIIGKPLKNIPWQDKPGNCKGVVWRYSSNPIIGRNPTKHCARVYNSAVIPYGSGFVGVFRADHTDGKQGSIWVGVTMRYIGKSKMNRSGGRTKKESRMIPTTPMIQGLWSSTASFI